MSNWIKDGENPHDPASFEPIPTTEDQGQGEKDEASKRTLVRVAVALGMGCVAVAAVCIGVFLAPTGTDVGGSGDPSLSSSLSNSVVLTVASCSICGSDDALKMRLEDGSPFDLTSGSTGWQSGQSYTSTIPESAFSALSSSNAVETITLIAQGDDGLRFSNIDVNLPGVEEPVQFTTGNVYVKCRSGECELTLQPSEPDGSPSCDLKACDPDSVAQTPPSAISSDFTLYDGLVATTHSFGEVWVDCNRRVPSRFSYTARCDSGCLDRAGHFTFAPDGIFVTSIPNPAETCQQTSTAGYPKICTEPRCGNCGSRTYCTQKCSGLSSGDVWSSLNVPTSDFGTECSNALAFDRGHQVPANHLDGNAVDIKQSNYMTNIAPQTASMNRGAWLDTEKLIECWRDVESLLVLGGAVFNETHDAHDWFHESHGGDNPYAFWKIIHAKDGGTISSTFGSPTIVFWIPNKDNEDDLEAKHVITVEELEARLAASGHAENFDLPNKADCWRGSDGSGNCEPWTSPDGCDLS